MGAEFEEGDPIECAHQFATNQADRGFQLDFSLESLEREIDRLLETPIFFRGRDGSPSVEQEQNKAGLCAYVGETLRQLFDGEWGGQFYPESTGVNFYTSFVQFGDYRYCPTHFISYRLTNWPKEGTFAKHLQKLLPSLQARKG